MSLASEHEGHTTREAEEADRVAGEPMVFGRPMSQANERPLIWGLDCGNFRVTLRWQLVGEGEWVAQLGQPEALTEETSPWPLDAVFASAVAPTRQGAIEALEAAARSVTRQFVMLTGQWSPP